MHILKATKQLVQKELAVIVCKRLRTLDYAAQIRIHELSNYIELVKLSCLRKLDILDLQNVVVLHKTSNFQLA
jgi:hypothetical protein